MTAIMVGLVVVAAAAQTLAMTVLRGPDFPEAGPPSAPAWSPGTAITTGMGDDGVDRADEGATR